MAFGVAPVALAGCVGVAGAQIPAASEPITPKEAQMGAQYHPVSSEVFVLLLVGVFFNTLAHVPYTLLQATGHA